MDSRQEIGLGASVAASQAYTTSTLRPDETTKTDSSINAVGGSGSSGFDHAQPERNTINPRTVLDPDLYVNVAQFSYGVGDVEFQVPSRSQLEAYRRNQNAEEVQVETAQTQTQERQASAQEAGDSDGVGDQTTSATATVTAAVVSQTQTPPTPPDTQRNGTSEGNRTSPGEPRRAVKLEA
ncbi:hypothetical protein [Rhodospirillum sp. A1_3_36]|uniref:hypothetical protein n=1 Tax=Rhodospirillum sp. A1_3_36 TaxID=3391666 RepID=UPI0039A57603